MAAGPEKLYTSINFAYVTYYIIRNSSDHGGDAWRLYRRQEGCFVSIVDADRKMLVQDIKLTLISLVVIMFCFMLVYFIYKYCFRKDGVTQADAAVMALISGSPTIGFLGFAVL